MIFIRECCPPKNKADLPLAENEERSDELSAYFHRRKVLSNLTSAWLCHDEQVGTRFRTPGESGWKDTEAQSETENTLSCSKQDFKSCLDPAYFHRWRVLITLCCQNTSLSIDAPKVHMTIYDVPSDKSEPVFALPVNRDEKTQKSKARQKIPCPAPNSPPAGGCNPV